MEATQHAKQDLEVRREAVGSDRRDESVMGPPRATFNMSSLPTNSQRNGPIGQDAPTALKSSNVVTSVPQSDIQTVKDDSKNDSNNLTAQQGASGNEKPNTDKNKKYKSKKDNEKDSDYRSAKSKNRKHGNNSRRSSTPDDFDNESMRHRNRSPNSSFSTSSNDRSSDLSESDDR